MALSGSEDFSLNRDELIEAAYELIGVKDPDSTLSANQTTTATRHLNMMLKGWTNKGLLTWKQDEAVVFPVVGQESFDLGPSGDRACLKSDLVKTTVDGDQTSVTTSLTVASTTGMAASDNIGVEVSGALSWVTITSVDSSTTLTIATLGGVDLDDGATVYTYTNILQRPNRVLSARRVDANSDTETPLYTMTRDDYQRQTKKSTQGKPVEVFYDRQLTDGRLYVWPTFEDVDNYLSLTVEKQIQDMDAAANDFDLPPHWLEAATYQLAVRIGTYHMIPVQRLQILKSEAQSFLNEALGFDQEESIRIVPERNR